MWELTFMVAHADSAKAARAAVNKANRRGRRIVVPPAARSCCESGAVGADAIATWSAVLTVDAREKSSGAADLFARSGWRFAISRGCAMASDVPFADAS